MSTPLAAVNNSTVSIIGDTPVILIVIVGTIPSGVQNIFSVDSVFILMETDLDNWAKTYTGAYTTATYTVPGTVIGTGASNVSSLTTNTKINGTNFVTKNTTFQLNLSVTIPATTPPPPSTPDPITTYTAQCSFTSVIQTKLKTS